MNKRCSLFLVIRVLNKITDLNGPPETFASRINDVLDESSTETANAQGLREWSEVIELSLCMIMFVNPFYTQPAAPCSPVSWCTGSYNKKSYRQTMKSACSLQYKHCTADCILGRERVCIVTGMPVHQDTGLHGAAVAV